ncbi:uncharacterized protein LOC141616995 [Silene latifolia]|uniref:uncharacterized protein LOC141616995 n=1 Tax=Silene latifolia TaxID=37657 RepID=UPI003D76C1E4
MKAYDYVSRKFLRELLTAFKFLVVFRELIMECVTGASFSIALNGEIFGFFPGKRGLRQGNAHSIMIFLRAYSAFSKASGLKMNVQKSCAYFNGVSTGLKKDIMAVSGFLEGKLPFKYFGVPITTGRNFLWERGTEYNRYPLIGWQKICVPKMEGGLRLKQSQLWNVAMVGKLVWWLAVKPDKLWVQWVNHIYLKGSSWSEYSSSCNVSWYWRKIYSDRDIIMEGFIDGQWTIGVKDYIVKSCYEWIRVNQNQVPWHRAV